MLKVKIPKMPKMPKIPTKILTAMGSYSNSLDADGNVNENNFTPVVVVAEDGNDIAVTQNGHANGNPSPQQEQPTTAGASTIALRRNSKQTLAEFVFIFVEKGTKIQTSALK